MNGDFETFSQCPDYVSQIDRATGWSRPTNGTSDYFNACLNAPFSMSVPGNQFGDQAARSGDGYAGFYCFHGTSPITIPADTDHEYVSRSLAQPLIAGKYYHVEFHVSLADVSKYSVKHIGALLSMDQPYRADDLPIEAIPQITSDGSSFLNDKDGWTKISTCFTADSAYEYITIGNFMNGIATEFMEEPTQFPLTYFSYYFIDDVSIVPVEEPRLGPDVESCASLTLEVLEPIDGVTYTWSTGETGTTLIADTSGTYWVMVEYGDCILSDTIEVRILDPIHVSPQQIIADLCEDPEVMLRVEGLPEGAMVTWANGATGDSVLVDHAGTYSYSVSSPDHCPANSTVTVLDECEHPVFIPNAFTPDGDGINDNFQPQYDPWSMKLRYWIYDRWGRVIFSSEGDAWTGDAIPIGTYQLQYEAQQIHNDRRRRGSGHVTLIR